MYNMHISPSFWSELHETSVQVLALLVLSAFAYQWS